jgi:hypothetical protein
MKVFHCERCNHLLFFENSQCVNCGSRLAYVPETASMASLPADAADENGDETVRAANPRIRLCRNYTAFDICNWAIDDDDDHALCRACRLTRAIPDTSAAENIGPWYRLEVAKRRLVFTLLALGLPVLSREEDPDRGLAFEFKTDPADPNQPRVLTGHAEGVITVNLAEADDAERERRKQALGEPYRTLLGHMRHESGHYYWDLLIGDTHDLRKFRELFGDEQSDYAEALQAHYATGPSAGWQAEYVSAYASAHPWEDWAETWAHYLHMVDALETAADNGMILKPARPNEPELSRISPKVMTGRVPFGRLIESWFPLAYVLNNLNRGLGLADGYPFVLSARAIDKLRFVHDVVCRATR